MNLHTAYIQSWAASIQNAPEELFRAIKDAEHISDYLLEKGEFKHLQDRQFPESPMYAGRIEYLSPGGTVVESMEFKTHEELVKAVKHESDIGAPFTLVLYDDKNGCTVSTEFLRDLSTPPCGIRHEDRREKGQDANDLSYIHQELVCAKRSPGGRPAPHRRRSLER